MRFCVSRCAWPELTGGINGGGGGVEKVRVCVGAMHLLPKLMAVRIRRAWALLAQAPGERAREQKPEVGEQHEHA